MKKVGLFLGIDSSAGGMLQYALSLMDALRVQREHGIITTIAYVSPSWEPFLKDYPFQSKQLWLGKFGLFLADVFMALQLPGPLARVLSFIFNPLSWQLRLSRQDVWIFPGQDALTYQAGVGAIGTVHDLMHRYEPHFPEVSEKNRSRIRDHRFLQMTIWSQKILVDSKVGKQHVIESYGVRPEKVCELPYVPSKYIYNDSIPEDFEKKYKLPQNFVFYPAQFWAHKNHLRLIESTHSVSKRFADFHLVLTGSMNREYSKILTRVKELGIENRIHFMGYIPDADLIGFYRKARALVMPTFFGPTNIPPLEAMVCGCPAIVSGIYGMMEQLGDAALYFDPKSVNDIQNKLEMVWSDSALREQMIVKGFERLKNWNYITFAERLRKILQE